MKVGKLGWLVAMFLSGGMAIAQGTADDYRRAYALKEKFSADKVFYSNVNPQWIEGTHQFWYVRNTPDGRLYVSVDADKKLEKNCLILIVWQRRWVLHPEKRSSRKLLHWGICRSVRDWIRYTLCLIINVGCMHPGKISWSMKGRFLSLPSKSIGWRWMMRRQHRRFRLLMVNG